MKALRVAFARHRGLVLGLAVTFLALAGLGSRQWAASRAAPTPTPEALGAEPIVWASGKVVPAQRATLSFGAPGQVVGFTVKEGDPVRPGDVIAFLNAPDLENAYANARAAARLADAEYADSLTAAQEAATGAAARASAARGDLAAALANRDKLLSTSAHDLAKARIAVDQAKDTLYGYQAQRDGVGGARDRKQATDADYDQAQANALAAEDGLRLAETELARLSAGPRPEDRAAADAAVQAARGRAQEAQAAADAAAARLARLKATGSTDAGTDDEPAAIAAARRDQARAALEAARTALAQTELKAPFAATVGSLLVQPGERVTPGQPIAIIGDLEALRVETSDLRETDVARVAVGQPVEISFDSLPEVRLPGQVSHLAPMATASQGGSSFVAWVTFDRLDPRVRWGMTAYTNIRVEPPR